MNTINSKTFKLLTPAGLIRMHKKPWYNVSFEDFLIKSHEIHKADLIIFKEGYNIKILKNKNSGSLGTIDPRRSREFYDKLKKLDPFSVKGICNKQQAMLSDVLDNWKDYFLNMNQALIVVFALQNRWYETKDKETLNSIKKQYSKTNNYVHI